MEDKKNRLTEVLNFVVRRTGANIMSASRQADVTDARALYYMIALKETKASMNEIGAAVGKSHSTVIHTRDNVMPLLKQDRFYMNIYREYFNIPLDKGNVRSIYDETLTENEKQYRELSDRDRLVYDERASLVLKSFAWKLKDDNRKEVFETINVSQ